MKKSFFLFAVVLLIISFSTNVQSDNVKNYQYKLLNKNIDAVFSNELSDSEAQSKKHYKVEYDSMDRIKKYRTFLNNKSVSTSVFYFNGDSKYHDKLVYYDSNGIKKYINKYERKSNGERIKVEKYNVDGKLTGAWTYKYSRNKVEIIRLSEEGKKISKSILKFDQNGILKSSKRKPSSKISYEYYYDTTTGRIDSSKKYSKGRHVGTFKNIYDVAGYRIEMVGISPTTGKKYMIRKYQNELLKTENYEYTRPTEYRYEYDQSGYNKECSFYQSGNLVCRFVYERYPNGYIKRTVAYDHSGDIIAEYPDNYVTKIKRDGTSLDGKKSIVHKHPSNYK